MTSVQKIHDAIGVGHLDIIECFRMGRSTNPNYIPIIKVRMASREAVQLVLKNAGRLKNNDDFGRVFIRESKPQWARNLEFNIKALAKRSDLTFTRGRISSDHH